MGYEHDDICKVGGETLIIKTMIMYRLVKSVRTEPGVESSSKENNFNIQKLDATVFSISDIFTSNHRPVWSISCTVCNHLLYGLPSIRLHRGSY